MITTKQGEDTGGKLNIDFSSSFSIDKSINFILFSLPTGRGRVACTICSRPDPGVIKLPIGKGGDVKGRWNAYQEGPINELIAMLQEHEIGPLVSR